MSDRVALPPAERIRYDPNAPAPLQRWVHIAIPKVGKPVQAVLVGEALVGVWTHWWSPDRTVQPHSIPCVLPRESCDLCAMPRHQARWTGYVAAWQQRPIQRYCLVQVTPHAVWSCPELVRPHLGTLRGLAITLRRDGRCPNSAVVAELSHSPIAAESLPDPIDVREALLRLWGYTSPLGLAWDDLYPLEVTGRSDAADE